MRHVFTNVSLMIKDNEGKSIAMPVKEMVCEDVAMRRSDDATGFHEPIAPRLEFFAWLDIALPVEKPGKDYELVSKKELEFWCEYHREIYAAKLDIIASGVGSLKDSLTTLVKRLLEKNTELEKQVAGTVEVGGLYTCGPRCLNHCVSPFSGRCYDCDQP